MHDERRASLVKRSKYVLTIVVVQAACLGVGLWMQHQFLRSSAREAALDNAWTQLAADGTRLAEVLRNGPHTDGADLSDSFAGSVATGTPRGGRSGLALLVDAQWNVLADSRGQRAMVRGIAKGDHIVWNPAAAAEGLSQPTSRGLVTIAGIQYIAVAAPVMQSGQRIVALRSVAPIESSAETALGSLPVISGLTFVWTCALLSITAYMVFSRFYDDAERSRTQSIAESLQQRQNLVRTRDAVVFGLAKLADSRDPETGDHLERIALYTELLASALRHHPKYGHHVTPSFIRLIGISSALHDIGKVGIEDCILLKKGALTPDERHIMQTHAAIGGECLRGIERRLGNSNFLQMAREIALTHHEKWDGTGYPRGLKGEDIPLAARIVAIADVYDALSSRRVYKEAHPHEQCEEIIRHSSGTHFDPDLVEVWSAIAPKFAEIALRYASQEPGGSSEDDRPPSHTERAGTAHGENTGKRINGCEPLFAAHVPVGTTVAEGAVHTGERFDERQEFVSKQDRE